MDTDGQRTGSPHNGTDVMDMQWGINQYLNNTGYAADYNETTVPWPEFYWIEEEVERCEDVVLLLGFWQYEEMGPGEWYWWRVGGHYVTCAGVNSMGLQLGISDPYWDNAEAGGPGVVPVPHTYPHGSGVHNDTQYVSHDIYNVVQLIPGPGGPPCWALQNYAGGVPIINFLGQNGGPGLIPQGPYDPIFPLVTVIDYAVAVSPTAVNATLVGNATFLRKEAPPDSTWETGLVVRFFDNATTLEMGWSPINVTTNNTGFFTITGLTPGIYDIGIKNWTTLSRLVTNVTLSAGMTTVVDFGSPKEGDVTDDDKCNILDLSALGSSFGKNKGDPGYNKWADLNRDDKVNILDLSTLGGSFGLQGDLLSY
jgi:hypothetical protein